MRVSSVVAGAAVVPSLGSIAAVEHADFCPSAGDFTIAYGTPQLNNQGWDVHGNGGVATKAAYNLLGGFVEFDIDLSSVHTGVNANIYTISPTIGSSGYSGDKYCDGAKTDDSWCLEVDWIESNGNCGGATTLHTIKGPGANGCTSWGCRASYHYNGKSSFHMRIEYGADGTWTTIRDGQTISSGSLSPQPNFRDWSIVRDAYLSKGAVIYSSEWQGWVPVSDCGTSGDLSSSHFSVSNLKIRGSVVQGPSPTKCAGQVMKNATYLVAPSSGGVCCYNSNICADVSQGCNAPTEWCSQSEENCNKCSGHYCHASPSPGPSPPPTPPSPTPAGQGRWCPSAADFVTAYGTPKLNNQGWEIHGNGGVATKAAYNLLGGSVEFDIDFSGVHTGVNANIYTISPTIDSSGYAGDKYCDGAKTDNDWCLEVDWIESNGNCGGATTLHTIKGPGSNGCTSWGCRASYHYNGKSSFHIRIEYGVDGTWTTIRDGQTIGSGSLSPQPNSGDWSIVRDAYASKGAVIYSSEWQGWVPVQDCGTSGDLSSSHFQVSNLLIEGSVVQGPTPSKCSEQMRDNADTLIVV